MATTTKKVRCKICRNQLFTWGVSGIETRFKGKKINLSFEDFVMCDKCADELRALCRKGE